jgi:hypothetical protein
LLGDLKQIDGHMKMKNTGLYKFINDERVKNSSIPSWAIENSGFSSITKTSDELSIVCPQDKNSRRNLSRKKIGELLKLKGPLGFTLTGIVSSLSAPLAKAKISILYVSDSYAEIL